MHREIEHMHACLTYVCVEKLRASTGNLKMDATLIA